MVALLTAKSPAYADVAAQADEIAERADGVRRSLVAAIDEDAVAFDRVSLAYRMPKADGAQKAQRSAAIQAALSGASEPPLRVVEFAREIAALAVTLVEFGNPNAISDLGCAALCAQAAARGAGFNVTINASALKDRASADRLTQRLDAVLAQVGLLVEVVLGRVEVGMHVP